MASKTSASSNLFSPQFRQVLTNLSQRIFYQKSNEYGYLHDVHPGSELCTSLVLQMSMFFNVWFFPFWLTSNALMLNIKYEYLDATYKVLLIATYVIFSIIEIIRLYLGYIGNLQEKSPELFGFLLFTILPQLPLLLFLLLNDNAIVMPLERAVDIILTVLFLLEIISAIQAARKMARQQATNYRLRQFIDLNEIQDNHSFIDPNAPIISKRSPYRA